MDQEKMAEGRRLAAERRRTEEAERQAEEEAYRIEREKEKQRLREEREKRELDPAVIRDFEQLRIEFLGRCRGGDVDGGVEEWISEHSDRIAQFRQLIGRARSEGHVSASMLAQIAGQARILLTR